MIFRMDDRNKTIKLLSRCYSTICTKQQRSKLSCNFISFSNTSVSCSDSVRNLGVIFDQELSFSKHISLISKSCHFAIRQIRKLRPLRNHNTAVLLANSLVFSKLDFCNSLFYDLPDKSIHRLQLIQNSLA